MHCMKWTFQQLRMKIYKKLLIFSLGSSLNYALEAFIWGGGSLSLPLPVSSKGYTHTPPPKF